jgi:hypothetical protein
MTVDKNDAAPHKVVIWISANIHEIRQKDGMCAGHSAHKVETFPLYIDGNNLNDAIYKLSNFITEVKEKCKQKV